ncbi:hypothetical protein ACM26V_09340 [Salipaludibacillus sp. HK11]|uniref:hypothetical protein n=1 Tax=Salipaludibacillus sp. HK11 TaxID=3394320 RepID=UPI0039FD4859
MGFDDVNNVEKSFARQTRKIQTGNTFIDELNVSDVRGIVLLDLKQLSNSFVIE